MDRHRFDALARRLGGRGSRRRALFSFAGVAFGLLGRADGGMAAGCRPNGEPCWSDNQCCSGRCDGRPRNRRCRQASGQGTCTTRRDFCKQGPAASGCNGNPTCNCVVTKGGASFCAQFDVACAPCANGGDCVAQGFPQGSVCVVANTDICNCDGSVASFCAAPCGQQATGARRAGTTTIGAAT